MEKETVPIIDRRGQNASSALSETPKPKPAGTPILFTCSQCEEDISGSVLGFQIMQPQPGPLGQIHFAQQTVFALPLICPHCKAPQLYQQGVARAGRRLV